MTTEQLKHSKLPYFNTNVGIDFGRGEDAMIIGLKCPRKGCGKVFFVKNLDDLGATAPCPHCMRVARIDGDR